ncbi:hypothetical protein LUZ60_016203 [Juncus effusus]|nr:hypothetical protein LUZ60_016203 [Juncus effusus]
MRVHGRPGPFTLTSRAFYTISFHQIHINSIPFHLFFSFPLKLSERRAPSFTTDGIRVSAEMKAGTEDWIDGAWTVDCSCGVKFDDGEEMVSCDNCGVWVHTRCAKFVKLKWEQSFKCHNCKQLPPAPVSFPPEKEKEEEEEGERVGSDNEETEVAQLLAELPLKTGPAPIPPVRKWEVPLRDKVHVQGIPGGDPSLFQNNLTSAFNANLWRCTGYIPKKFGFQYLEFPCWKEGKEGERERERDGLFKEGADALFALSKQAEVAAVSSPQNVVRKIFQLGDTVERANKKKEKEKEKEKYRFKDLSFGDCSSKKKKKDKNKDRIEKRKSLSSFSIDVKQTCASISDREMQIEESVIPEGKSETKIEESNLSDNHYVDESFGDEEIKKDLAEDLLNLSNVSKVLDCSNNNNLPDIAEKTETNQSNEIQEKVKDESERETLPTQINNSTNLEKKIDINNVTVKTEEAKDKDNNSNKSPHIAQDDVSTTQHDVSKSEPGTDESNTGAPTPLPKPSSPPFNPLVHRGPGPSRTESATDQSKKHPIIYHAKTSASSLHKSNQASKINASCANTGLKSNKASETNLSQHVVKASVTCHVVDESTSSTSRKQGSDAPDPPANLSDEQLALLLHQQLNSSPRVPRVPRLRHTPAGPTAHPTPTSVLSKRSSRDHPSGAKKKLRGEDITRESSRDSSGLNTNERGLNKSTGQSKSTSVNSDKKPPAQQSPTVSSTEAATSGNPQVVVEPGDCTSQKYPSLPGLIDEVLNATPHVTYEEICRNVSMHWNNLRKPNGERYAYTSPTHAVHDILRNRKEWAHLIDQAPKAYRRKNVIMTEEKPEEKSEESDSVGKDFPKGKRKARKRRRLDNKSVREMKKKNLGSESPGSESPSDSSSDNEEEGKHDDEMISSDDVSGAQTAGSSSSD